MRWPGLNSAGRGRERALPTRQALESKAARWWPMVGWVVGVHVHLF